MIEIAILAPSIAMRAGLRALFEADARFVITVEASVLSELDGTRFDVLVALPAGLEREELVGLLSEAEPLFAVLLLSHEPADVGQLQAMDLRAWGLLPEDAAEEELYAAVAALHEGLLVGAPALMRSLLGQMTAFNAQESLVQELTPRENEVLDLLADGLANKQIAVALGISEHTVKFHISSIYNKLSVTNRAEAVRVAARLGLIVL